MILTKMTGNEVEGMRELWKQIRKDIMITAILCVILGVMIMVWPTQTTKLLCWILAGILILMGLSRIIAYFNDRMAGQFGLAAGIVLFVLGAWILIRPLNFAKIFPIVIGVLLLMHGVEDLKMSIEAKAGGDSIWWTLLLVAAVNMLLGLLLIWRAFAAVQIAMMLMGAALVYDGITDLFAVYRVAKTVREAKKDIIDIDIEDKD